MKRFQDLFIRLKPHVIRGGSIAIQGLTEDSREVTPGMVFVACRGTKRDGHAFIPQAVAQGAVAIVAEEEVSLPAHVGYAKLQDTRQALGDLVSAFYDFPQERLTLLGVTGTNGKTSVAWFLQRILKTLGLKTGLLGTIFYDLGSRCLKAQETTPPPTRLIPYLAAMCSSGVKCAVLEVSSHALDQGRVEGLVFQGAAFTNLSHDHLDYHKDMEAYFEAKQRLFTSYLHPQGQAVINVSDPWGRRLISYCKGKVLKVGEDITGEILARSPRGLSLRLRSPFGDGSLSTKVLGDFQLENLLLAIGLGLGLDLPFQEILAALADVSAPPGRLELVAEVRGAYVFVDYAHTPQALKAALQSLRPVTKGRLLVLFGCGGNRDQEKRPEMGRIAENEADLVFLTSDNPRDEDPEEIISEICQGMKKKPFIEVDRRKAIQTALQHLSPGDVLLVAGKGHEDYQERGGKRFPFSDQAVIREIILAEAA